MKRIGIYPGVFNPVHAGHIGFALQALKDGKLDQVVFLPERQPRYKPGVEHYAHRIAMIKQAIKPYERMAALEVVDRHFTVKRTLPTLRAAFPGAELVMLVGSDAATTIPRWQQATQLMEAVELMVAVRSGDDAGKVAHDLAAWPVQPRSLHVMESAIPDVSSSNIRRALRTQRYAKGLLTSVKRYATREWLYVSLTSVQKTA